MKRLQVAVLVIALILLGLLLYGWYGRLPVIDWAARLHSVPASIDCGHATNSAYRSEEAVSVDAAINCALSANEAGRPFMVIFTEYGTDEQMSNAVIRDANGNAIELLHATGAAGREERSKLLKHPL